MSIELPKMIPEITNVNVEHKIKYFSNGQKKFAGSYVSFHPVFTHTSWYENGHKKSEGFYRGSNQRYGEWNFWHSNGKKACTGIYEEEAQDKDGLWKFWNESGAKVHENYYNEIELTFELMITNEFSNLRINDCSQQLIKKFGNYIFLNP